MKNPKRQITLYLSEAEYARLVTTARVHKHSLSGHVKHLIRGAGEFAEGPEDRVLSKVTAIQIAVDAPQPLAVLEESAVLAIARMQADGWHYIRS